MDPKSPSSVTIRGRVFSMKYKIGESSVNYEILSYLPLLQIIRLQQLNRRYYNEFVPTTLTNVTISGTIPCSNTRQLTFALQFETSKNL